MSVRQVVGSVGAVAGVGLWLAVTSIQVTAHHAFAAEFDCQAILINNAGGNHESRPVLERDSERWVKGVSGTN